MKLIQLSQGMVTKVDDADFEWLSRWKWHAHKSRGGYYAARTVRHGQQFETIRMHRLIMATPKGLETDHADMDTLNNQRYNLENVTVGENQRRAWKKLNDKKSEGEVPF